MIIWQYYCGCAETAERSRDLPAICPGHPDAGVVSIQEAHIDASWPQHFCSWQKCAEDTEPKPRRALAGERQ